MSFVLTVSFVIYDEKHKMSNTYTLFCCHLILLSLYHEHLLYELSVANLYDNSPMQYTAILQL